MKIKLSKAQKYHLMVLREEYKTLMSIYKSMKIKYSHRQDWLLEIKEKERANKKWYRRQLKEIIYGIK